MMGEKLGEFRYPPYTDKTVSTARMLMKHTEIPSVPAFIKYLTVFGLGIVFVVAMKAVAKAASYKMPDWI